MGNISNYTITVHTDWPEKGVPPHFIKAFKKTGQYVEGDADIVFNIDSIHNSGLKRGNKLTIYYECDDFMHLGRNTQWYDVDLLYTTHRAYKAYYPAGTRTLYPACDPEIHTQITDPIHDYVFIGSIEPLPVYESRIRILDTLLRSGRDVWITHGTRENYTKLLSSGKILLNILPQNNGFTCINLKVMEMMAVGCLFVNYHPLLDEVAVEGVHYFDLFRDVPVDSPLIEQVALQGREHVLTYHTWDHRVEQVLQDIHEYIKE